MLPSWWDWFFQTSLPTVLEYVPAGASYKQFRHFRQITEEGTLSHIILTNVLHYNPPVISVIYKGDTTDENTPLQLSELIIFNFNCSENIFKTWNYCFKNIDCKIIWLYIFSSFITCLYIIIVLRVIEVLFLYYVPRYNTTTDVHLRPNTSISGWIFAFMMFRGPYLTNELKWIIVNFRNKY